VTFKDNCPDIRNSKVIDLIQELQTWNVKVVVEDPWADPDEVLHEYGVRMGKIESAGGVDSLVIAVGHREFRAMELGHIRSLCRTAKPVLADLKCVFDRHAATAAGFTVFRL